jgi:hypothetical protein
MALALLDGTTAAVDFTSKLTTGGSLTSFKCIANRLALIIQRATTDRFTFCSGGWAQPVAGIRAGFGRLDGFASKGAPISDPLALIAVDDPLDFVFTVDTLCTLSGKLIAVQDGAGVQALGESTRGIDFRTYGAVTSAWVIA